MLVQRGMPTYFPVSSYILYCVVVAKNTKVLKCLSSNTRVTKSLLHDCLTQNGLPLVNATNQHMPMQVPSFLDLMLLYLELGISMSQSSIS